ncbi:MAG: hypothetical protein ACTHK2_04985 [Dokdonella sp.]|uniref:hypothetical protein n=1 Tax=Dokdonella sp. TaxID=2291710 RepID=UPI003F818F1E
MSEPLSWQALQDVGTLLDAISVDAGYHTDLGTAKRYFDRSQKYDAAEPFVVVVADDIRTREASSGKRQLASDMTIVVQYAIPFGTESAELVAHRGRADIVRCLLTNLRGKALGFTEIVVTSSSITDAPADGSNLVIAQVEARASLSETPLPAT